MPDATPDALTNGLLPIASQFVRQGQVTQIQPLGNGNINDTFLVRVDAARTDTCFVLQRLNTQVFPCPQQVMHNIHIYTEHVRQRLVHSPPAESRRWEIPRVLLTQTGQNGWLSPEGSFWRALSFIPQALTVETLQTREQAQEVGFGLGMFHTLISDLPPEQLADTLVGFHIAPRYLQQYETVLAALPETAEAQYCYTFIAARQAQIGVLEQAKQRGKLPLRSIHGDPKVNNILFDKATRQAISLVDLDTIKPGLVHYDIGDCLRSGCNLLGEETDRWQTVRFELDLCESMLQGYCAIANAFLTPADYAYLYDAIWLLPYELGLRFFTDYLAGDVYFKTTYAKHNLARALVQFKLVESIEAQESAIRAIIQALCKG
ncbi:MAG: aminoglycoside phosphotransferase family protein [Leptolyngbya sp. SIO4C1]|nr:aminoglycoside phosphotransferase family protein [Leptolyngbya sp. SIO4C1]